MSSISSIINVKQCSLCHRETEHYCHSCQEDLCRRCKEWHVIDLNMKYHEVTIYRDKFKYLPKREICVIHPNKFYNAYCEVCKLPTCSSCSEHLPQRSFLFAREHSNHKHLDIRTAYQTTRKQHKEFIQNVRGTMLYNSQVLLKQIKSDVISNNETCQKIIRGQSEMIKRGQGLKDLMDSALLGLISKENVKYTNKVFEQQTKMIQFISRLHYCEHACEQSAHRPVGFLRYIKNVRLPQIQDMHRLTHHWFLSMTQTINMEDLIVLLSDIKLTLRGKFKMQTENELALVSSPVLQNSFEVKNIVVFAHISFVTPDRIWVSDKKEIILTDTATGDNLYSVNDFLYSNFSYGKHTENRKRELIFINEDFNIIKLSNDTKTTTLFIKNCLEWKYQCVYWSTSTEEVLVGMSGTYQDTGQVRRYNNNGKLIQTVPHDNESQTQYKFPIYITENNNGDVVVSDDGHDAVLVTERGGKHRFSYTGPPMGSGIWPRGICTDALSNILLCDSRSKTVQIITKDGLFLSYLLTHKFPEIYEMPWSLSYDTTNHLLLIGSMKKISVYRHLNRNSAFTDPCDFVNTAPKWKSEDESNLQYQKANQTVAVEEKNE